MTVLQEPATTGARPAQRRFDGARSLVAGAIVPPLLFCLLLALGWGIMARRLHSPLVPTVGDVVAALSRIVGSGDAFIQIGITLERIAFGFTVAFVVAIAVGTASGRNKTIRAFFEPALLLGLTVPGLIWALLCVIWFGIGLRTSTTAIALGTAPALIVSIMHGIRSIDTDVIEMAHVFRFSPLARLRYVWLPAILPFLLSGARLGFSHAWKVIVLVEIFGLSDGVGYQLNADFSAQDVAGMLAWTVAFGITMAVIEYGLLQNLERYLTRWRKAAKV
jgi:NitT/TauT family transport system permease protein